MNRIWSTAKSLAQNSYKAIKSSVQATSDSLHRVDRQSMRKAYLKVRNLKVRDIQPHVSSYTEGVSRVAARLRQRISDQKLGESLMRIKSTLRNAGWRDLRSTISIEYLKSYARRVNKKSISLSLRHLTIKTWLQESHRKAVVGQIKQVSSYLSWPARKHPGPRQPSKNKNPGDRSLVKRAANSIMKIEDVWKYAKLLIMNIPLRMVSLYLRCRQWMASRMKRPLMLEDKSKEHLEKLYNKILKAENNKGYGFGLQQSLKSITNKAKIFVYSKINFLLRKFVIFCAIMVFAYAFGSHIPRQIRLYIQNLQQPSQNHPAALNEVIVDWLPQAADDQTIENVAALIKENMGYSKQEHHKLV